MSKNASLLLAANILLLTSTAYGQQPANTGAGDKSAGLTGVAGLLQSVGAGDIVQTASDLRKASESLERFGESLKVISSAVAEAASSTSRNLAAIGGEFDPLGFKAAFETMQQQNAIIQAQHQLIIELQQKEIRRLEEENTTAKRAQRPTSRSKRSGSLPKRQKKPKESQVSE